MQVVERDETFVLGIEVVAAFEELGTAVPRTWQRLFGRRAELGVGEDEPFVEASRHLGNDFYRETVGVVVTGARPVPDGMVLTTVPAGCYVHHRHEGPVQTIADGFRSIYDWAAAEALRLGDAKLDVGYTVEGVETAHDLYVDVLP